MKAVVVSEYGGPDVLRLVDVPEPHAGPGQIRMRVHAATVSPSDIMLRVGDVATMNGGSLGPPFSPGSEAAGVVDEIGPGAETDLKIGDRVMAFIVPFMPSGGAYAQHLVLDPRQVAAAPAGSSHAQAATIPLNGMTAQQAIDLLSMAEGDWLAVTGAVGAMGGYTIQLAKAAGLHVVADAAPVDEELVRSLGADRVVARGAGVAERIREAVPGGVSGLVDCALLGREILPAIRAGGQAVMARRSGLPGAPELGDHGDVTVHEVFVMDDVYEHDKLEGLRVHAEKGELTMRVAAEYPAARAAEAHRRFEAGGVRGRLVLTF
ncbi:NADP-dependent oxidoreductase [Streptomyces phaeochromogenes]|uniref:NADP-dependent oxidoreductase n=1 Tax=Streptomyces phaeochromogenes TaxID=1923 RepID=A0ABZ1H710_STRPH|nr:NADP-dependent oxidoreductase [Streptomyces phaeochromogenes]WSD14338.1 NADP-dependent oxidoreductase [Streptomyces phaeochromogenes]